MAKNSTLISGFGGQGVLLFGSILAEAGAALGKWVSFLPAYGPEARGGTAFCTTIISDTQIISPLIDNTDNLVALNNPAAERFLPKLKAGGTLLLNSSLVPNLPHTDGYHVYKLPASQLAEGIGSPRCLNMLCLGALLKVKNLAPLSLVKNVIRDMLGEERKDLIELNFKALELGYNYF
ncbi:2-oxoacid:acceptor oxidoreductase family protein [Zhaonella formicivorans]|uniref:2-oxoacid:acceptor oxidoreductase family protein n=1 Tax=Zhaonella formicivorans TaxID=2528593 RepID=UPI0010D7CB00|nr:2-oxoacid:acceptor oxidoreductase family protein [Zhaonella formicivorans]